MWLWTVLVVVLCFVDPGIRTFSGSLTNVLLNYMYNWSMLTILQHLPANKNLNTYRGENDAWGEAQGAAMSTMHQGTWCSGPLSFPYLTWVSRSSVPATWGCLTMLDIYADVCGSCRLYTYIYIFIYIQRCVYIYMISWSYTIIHRWKQIFQPLSGRVYVNPLEGIYIYIYSELT